MAEKVKHDGRFGAQFDDEISGRGVIGAIGGVVALMVLGMIAMVIFQRTVTSNRDAPAVAATPRLVAEATRLAEPGGPLLQVDPEHELVLLRREMARRLNGFGWVDQAAGIVHIPVADAMALVLDRGLASSEESSVSVDQDTEAVPDEAAEHEAHGS